MSVATEASAAWPSTAAGGLPQSMAARITLILEAFEPRTVKLSLDEIAFRALLPRSTTHRILDQLVQLGWIERALDGYGMGWRSRNFFDHDNGNSRIRAEAAPLLHKLQISTGMVVHLAVLDGHSVHYLDRLGGHSAVSVPSRVGGNNPAHGTALGKAMLAWQSPETIDELFKEGLRPLTGNTINDTQAFYTELNHIRGRGGLAYESGESFHGIACVAVAIRSRQGPVASISLAGSSRDPIKRVAPLVANAARKVSSLLFPSA